MNLRLILKNKIRVLGLSKLRKDLERIIFSKSELRKKILKEFLAEGHRRISSPFLVIFMSLAAAFTILFGSSKQSNTTKRISLLSAIIVSLQAIYIVAINTINFTLINILIFYSIFRFLIAIPILLIEYEKKFINTMKF